MDRIKNPLGLQIITNNRSIKRVNGMKILKLNNFHSVWSWSEDEILIHETTILSAEQETFARKSSQSSKMVCRNVSKNIIVVSSPKVRRYRNVIKFFHMLIANIEVGLSYAY